jgi:rare lipoprotein A (peptidoglycan hydrolase)
MFIAVVATIQSSGCAKHVSVVRPVSIGHSEKGIASWYGTWVEVTNLENAKRVVVRITDRGPFVHGRIIDLSRAAAREIDLITPGVVRVRLRVVRAPTRGEGVVIE